MWNILCSTKTIDQSQEEASIKRKGKRKRTFEDPKS
jgi:hypothetical protein